MHTPPLLDPLDLYYLLCSLSADIDGLPCYVSLANILNLHSVVKALSLVSPIGKVYVICKGSD